VYETLDRAKSLLNEKQAKEEENKANELQKNIAKHTDTK